MIDTREAILVRLQAICAAVPGVNAAYRNRTQFAEDSRPCIVIMDGDEIADERDNNLSGLSPRRMEMSPEVYLLIGSQPEDVGTDLNGLRSTVVYDVLTDTTLQQLSLNNCAISYEGCRTIIEDGRRIEGALSLNFSILYLLRPADLAPGGSGSSGS
ncbi:MAG: hypothetical protein V3V97_17980 [Hyphomicrobiaceae bacterium]